MEKINRLILSFLLAVIVLAGCAAPKPAPDPLAGWTPCWSQDPKDFDKITADCHAYINELPQELKVGVGPIEYLEDGTGQHAVRFETGRKEISYAHVLIYGKDNKRIKTVEY